MSRAQEVVHCASCQSLAFNGWASNAGGPSLTRRQVLTSLCPAKSLAFAAALSLCVPRPSFAQALSGRIENSEHSAVLLLPEVTKFPTVSVARYRRLPEMAWRSHGSTNSELVAALRRNGILTSPGAIAAMSAVDRMKYVPPSGAKYAYLDSPQSIGYNATISAPHMHAMCLDILKNQIERNGSSTLDVGSGSGYLAACMARMALPYGGRVVGIEHIDGLTQAARSNVRSDPAVADLLGNSPSATLQLVTGDGRKGFAPNAPYDAIHVGAAADNVPVELVSQLKPGGRMVIPVGKANNAQVLMKIDKNSVGEVTYSSVTGVRYVPLCDETSQWP
mmetsp:Transcript_2880/g.7905  ORF Transcript_2880/g.7905 Transcript_2880/m.7905 type:complete len:334 (-) Transcript_2880:110-1111(-)|eukprot:CAMPEP_0185834766 /NCGR_PEP_ID=MMETSP1353-20130828/6175_1 /TAXON_ID=1077150 /ORGANISM="Erythrolobus australicus, Strain CCMP3124" /LENGTH=333 /DNA_ID=CAMNT_0028533261 /DNA_START=136 /DNA_END=1137 /DNA_ORIENTATION=-